MPKYSFSTKQSKEVIKATYCQTYEEAVIKFAKIKVLPLDKFLELYEVIER